jgi:hypothetical protein
VLGRSPGFLFRAWSKVTSETSEASGTILEKEAGVEESEADESPRHQKSLQAGVYAVSHRADLENNWFSGETT